MAKFIITYSRPVLTDEERAKRMEIIKKAATDLLIATERARKEKLKNEARGL